MSNFHFLAQGCSQIKTLRGCYRIVCYTTIRLHTDVDGSNHSDQLRDTQVTRQNESLLQQKARLLYQSRKRGMLENGLLLSTFAHKHLHSLSPELTEQYDKLINYPSNDWDIYYWLVGKQPVPQEYNNEIMHMLQTHVKNKCKEQRLYQPSLPT